MEEFKSLNEISEPDERNTFFVLTSEETGKTRPLTMEDIYHSIESINLKNTVPEDIRSQFNVAKNLAVYSWYCYSFHQIADLKAFSTIESALKLALKKDNEGLRKLLKLAVNKELLRDEAFSHLDTSITNESWVEKLPDILPFLRNKLAHGSNSLYPGSVLNLRISADLINQLF